MDTFYDKCPRKLLIKHLQNSKTPSPVWVNGKIEQTVGTNILIIDDGTGKVKICNCDSIDSQDKSWITKGSHCCVIGMLIKTKGVPEISPVKLINIPSSEMRRDAWNLEVEELNLYLEGKILPNVGA